ncbi:MAG: hypothetical protein V8T24_06355 [Roseburia hominis]
MKKIKNLKMMWKFSDETGNYEVSMPMLAVKVAGCVIALFFVFSVLWALIVTAVDEGKYSGDAYHLDWCEREYIDRGYHELYDTLDLYRLTSDKYALYWEMVNGYRDHTLYTVHIGHLARRGLTKSPTRRRTARRHCRSLWRKSAFSTGARCLTMRVPANLRRISAT